MARHWRWPLGDFGLGLFAAFSYGVGNVLRGAGVRAWPEPVLGTLIGIAVAVVLYAVVGAGITEVLAAARVADRLGLVLWGLSGVLTTVAQICVTAAAGLIPVAVAVVISSAFPIVLMPISLVVFRNAERLTGATASGAVLTVVGVAVLVLYG